MALIDWLVILGYFCALAAVVFCTLRRRKIASGEDLFLGGRSVGWLAIGASIFAANIGSEHLIGLAGSGASYGMSLSHLEFHSFIIIFMCWVLLPFYYKSGVSTMPEFLERRFGARARWILSVVSLAAYVLTKISVTVFAGALFFEVMMPEVQLVVGGTVISSFWIGAVLTVLLAGIYSSIGGLSAVVYTDLVQTGIILLGALSVTAFALHHLGGPVEGWATLKATIASTGNAERFGLWHSLSHKTFPWLGLIIASTTIGVWYWCTDQFIVQRCLAAKNLTNARRGAIWGGYAQASAGVPVPRARNARLRAPPQPRGSGRDDVRDSAQTGRLAQWRHRVPDARADASAAWIQGTRRRGHGRGAHEFARFAFQLGLDPLHGRRLPEAEPLGLAA